MGGNAECAFSRLVDELPQECSHGRGGVLQEIVRASAGGLPRAKKVESGKRVERKDWTARLHTPASPVGVESEGRTGACMNPGGGP